LFLQTIAIYGIAVSFDVSRFKGGADINFVGKKETLL
jgi:hypothetical protein